MLFDRTQLLKSITNADEKIVFAKVLDHAQIAMNKKIATFTDFLDPAKIHSYENQFKFVDGIVYRTFGGYQGTERSMIGFCPDFLELTDEDFPICVIKIETKDKFCEGLTHRQYLGSIIGTGIERTKLGDIIVLDECAYVFVHKTIADYICINLTRISRTKVECSIINPTDIILPQQKFKLIHPTVASLRVDAVISAAFNISRGQAVEFINAEKVMVNWSIVKSASYSLKPDDLFTLRGYGRAKIVEITGKTKKDRLAITIQLYI